jgi:radical SAM superfamily enzyme with C-terminal helix-hairpin-helix motif
MFRAAVLSNCEFCDIIELYGRVPRAKTNEQMLKELDALYALGYRGHGFSSTTI